MEEVTRYPYTTEYGELLYWQVRFDPKSFRPQMPDGTWGMSVGRILYRLPDIARAISNESYIYMCEGEKDADNLADLGLTTTTAGPASAWSTVDVNPLTGAWGVVLLPDNDEAGRSFAEHMAPIIRPYVKRLQIVRLPGLPNKGDVTDWLEAGHTVLDLQRIRAETFMWKAPPNKHVPKGYARRQQRYTNRSSGVPYDIGDIIYELHGNMYGGDRGTAYCPAHDDEGSGSQGLSLKGIDDDNTLVYCHSNCTFTAISAAITKRMESKA